MSKNYVIGVDFGTDSVRSIVVDTSNGEELATAVFYYPRWKKQLYCDAAKNQFRQHPLDYIEGLENTISSCVTKIGSEAAKNIVAISVDTTGSSPVAVDKTGTPLSLLSGFEENPNAMFVLWKDHTSVKEAAEINAHATKFEINYLQFVGGIYSSEWFWAKLLHILRADPSIVDSLYSFVEHCDWIPFLLTGGKDIHQMKRGICSAGHKALFAQQWNGLPPNSFFASLDPLLEGINERMFNNAYPADESVGNLSPVWASKLGLSENVIVGVGAFDAHMGAVGGQIESYHLSKVMGTSTCDMLVAPTKEVEGVLVQGICGQVPGSVIPGMMGMEAGQSAFGDAYAWFKNILTWPLQNILATSSTINEELKQQLLDEIEHSIIPALSQEAALIIPDEHDVLSLDWLNGRRTPDANQILTATISGLKIGTNAVDIFRSIVEATCFGAKAIVDRFEQQGIPVKGIIGLGGVAKKSPFIMQMMADVLNRPIRIHKSEQTCALGAAMFAATAAGVFDKVEDAMQAMGQGFDATYYPNEKLVSIYQKRYQSYIQLGNQTEQLIA
jgi:L-ribulokinase